MKERKPINTKYIEHYRHFRFGCPNMEILTVPMFENPLTKRVSLNAYKP